MEIIRLINTTRAKGVTCPDGRYWPLVGQVSHDTRLFAAARAHSHDLLDHDLMGHVGSDGSTPEQRAARAGFTGGHFIGEIVLGNADTPSEALGGWLGSPSHCAAIMEQYVNEAGAGFAWRYDPGNPYMQSTWTVEFGLTD